MIFIIALYAPFFSTSANVLADVSLHNTNPSVSLVNTWSRSYRIGDNFTLPCRISLPHGTGDRNIEARGISSPKDGKPIIQFVRLIGDEDIVISTGTELAKQVASSRRYVVTIRRLNNRTITAVLHITRLSYSDGGRLGCKVGGKEYGLTAYTGSEVIVNVPITEVLLGKLSPNGTYLKLKGHTHLHMTNSYRPTKSGFYCQVSVLGGSIEPEVTLFIGKKKVTKYCKKTVQRTWKTVDNIINRGYLVRYAFQTWHPRWMMDGDRLLCKARVPQYPQVDASAILNITYSPSILCKEKAYSIRGTKNAVVKCLGRMNPPPTFIIWWWPAGIGDVVIHNGEHKYGYRADFKVLSRGLYEFYLNIDFVAITVFRWYTLEVDNGMGLRRRSIPLVEGIDPDGTNSIHTNSDLSVMCFSVLTGYMTRGYMVL